MDHLHLKLKGGMNKMSVLFLESFRMRARDGREKGCRKYFQEEQIMSILHRRWRILVLFSKTLFLFIVYFYTQRIKVFAPLLKRKELICRLATPPTPASEWEREGMWSKRVFRKEMKEHGLSYGWTSARCRCRQNWNGKLSVGNLEWRVVGDIWTGFECGFKGE